MDIRKKDILKLSLYILLIIALVVVDQYTKQYMLNISSGLIGYTIQPFDNNFLLLTYVENHGGIFGIFQGHIKLFTILSTILIGYVIYMEYDNILNYSTMTKIGICFITAGGIGNMLDRIFRGYVIDMINFHSVWKYIFNVADMYIHIGIYIIVIYYLFSNKKEK